MDPSIADLSQFRASNPEKTLLEKLCGSQQRFCDRYEILRVLGRGGFGITFLARDSHLPGQPLCVIKQLCPKVSDPSALQRARKRFEQEARMLSKLGSHAQIPTLLNYFEQEGEFYLVQEYIRGWTLAREVRRGGPFSEAKVKHFLLEFLPLLQYVHDNRVIHRDIKPPNLLRCRDDGRLVLIDFGAVKEVFSVSEGSSSSLRHSSTQFVGTVGFAPPEQLASRPLFSSDLYAIGITCLYLLTGQSPLEFDYEFSTGEVHWQNYITVSPFFGQQILSKLLKVSPRERFQSARDVLRALALEPDFDSLIYCMNVNPKPFPLPPPPEPQSSEGYVPPWARHARAIREWQAKQKARRAHSDSPKERLSQRLDPRFTVSNSKESP